MEKLIFIKKKNYGGVETYQNNLLKIFLDIPDIKTVVISEEIHFNNAILNSIFQSLYGKRIVHIITKYIILLPQILKHRDAKYLFIIDYFKYGLLAVIVSSLFKMSIITCVLGWTEKELRLYKMNELYIYLMLKYELYVYKKAKYILAGKDLLEVYAKKVKDANFISLDPPIDTHIFKPIINESTEKIRKKYNNNKLIFTSTSLGGPKGLGIKILAEAFSIVKRNYPNVILLIAGDGPDRNKIINYACKFSGIEFLGYTSNILNILNSSDIFVMIFPFGGGIGMSIKEAMSCEKSCVVSRTPGTEVLKDKDEILLVEYNPQDIAEKILFLLNNPQYTRNVGISARKRVEKDYTLIVAKKKLIDTIFNKK